MVKPKESVVTEVSVKYVVVNEPVHPIVVVVVIVIAGVGVLVVDGVSVIVVHF